jgi:predicted CopG family antitoxin
MAKRYTKTINVTESLHAWIEDQKICGRETFNDVLERLLNFHDVEGGV